MIIKNKKLKYILILAITLILLCIGKNVRAANEFSATHGRKPYPNYPIECEEQGNDGINFFCMNEGKAWNWYSNSENISIIDPMKYYYIEQGRVEVEPSICFGLYTAKELGWINLETIQNLIWGSVKYSYLTCEAGDSSLYTNATNVIIKRADQFGMFYYGVLGGGSNKLEMTVSGGETAKVFINQNDKTVVLGPYRLNLVCHNVTKIDEEIIKANLYNELSGTNATLYPYVPTFAECDIQVDGAKDIMFLSKDGEVLKFPNFNEDFYIKCTVEGTPSTLHPIVNITYKKSAECNSGYRYISEEAKTKIPGYAVFDDWFDLDSATSMGKNGFPHDYAIDFIAKNVTVGGAGYNDDSTWVYGSDDDDSLRY